MADENSAILASQASDMAPAFAPSPRLNPIPKKCLPIPPGSDVPDAETPAGESRSGLGNPWAAFKAA